MIMVTGAKGMLGRELTSLLDAQKRDYAASGHEIDISNKGVLLKYTENRKIDFIINCAAYTNVDKAEDEKELCRNINTIGAENIAYIAKQLDVPLIHISTDYIFSCTTLKPYKENDTPEPLSFYGKSKLEGEQLSLSLYNKAYIVRTSWLYGQYGNNFVNTMLNILNNKPIVKAVSDQYSSPTWTLVLSDLLLHIVDKRPLPGIYHAAASGGCSRFEWVKAIYEYGVKYKLITNECTIESCSSREFPAKAIRPVYSCMDNSKLQDSLGITIPNWKESLEEYIAKEHHHA